MKLSIPQSIRIEHENLSDEIENGIKSGGKIARALEELIEVMHPHFLREEEIVMPILYCLKELSIGENLKNKDRLISLSKELKKEYKLMLREHQDINKVAENLKRIASRENRQDVINLTNHVSLHAQMEEEIFYPAAILVGKCVKP